MGKRAPFFFSVFLVLFCVAAFHLAGEGDTSGALSAFADPARIWGGGVERVIEEAYRRSFKTYIIDGRVMNLRMPFAENHEREILVDAGWEFTGKGKADPTALWPVITEQLATEDFKGYLKTLSDGREKVIIFDIPNQLWTVSRDFLEIARMKAGSYQGLPHRPYVFSAGGGVEEPDVYNYLYCIGWTGLDCSGFVWYVLSYIAKQDGKDLGALLAGALGVPRGAEPSYYAGTHFYSSNSQELAAVEDRIANVRPADILLFRGSDGQMVHSAIIQSVNFASGVIRYLQSTDEAPLEDRGIHESFIYFDPAHPELSLKDERIVWAQERYAPFPGELASAFSNDGERYRAYEGGAVVRLKRMAAIITRING
jgi:hypothetical protein